MSHHHGFTLKFYMILESPNLFFQIRSTTASSLSQTSASPSPCYVSQKLSLFFWHLQDEKICSWESTRWNLQTIKCILPYETLNYGLQMIISSYWSLFQKQISSYWFDDDWSRCPDTHCKTNRALHIPWLQFDLLECQETMTVIRSSAKAEYCLLQLL